MTTHPAPTLGGPRPGVVTDWIEFSAVDGPGNRSVLFLQGCTFDCPACHNPYTINPCTHCRECVLTCNTGALEVDFTGKVTWDPGRCAGDDACISACRFDSTPKTRRLGVADVLDRLRPTAPFLSGITISGGEATRQAVFLRQLFMALRDDPELSRLTRFIDTNGDVNGPIWDLLCPVMDAAMVDLKCFDDQIHRRLTGVGNAKVLATIETLAGRGQLHEVRLLMLPGHNDADDLLESTGRWLAGINPWMRVKVIGFRNHGVRPTSVPLVEPTPDQLAHYRAVLAGCGDFDLVVV